MSAAQSTRPIVFEGGVADLDEVMATMDTAFDLAFGEAWTRSQCSGILSLPGVWLLIARHGGHPAGFALVRTVCDEAELLLLAVPPSARRQGNGGALLATAAADARTRRATRFHLEMREGNPAQRLYMQAGFVEVGRRRGYYRGADGRSLDAITLARDLAP